MKLDINTPSENKAVIKILVEMLNVNAPNIPVIVGPITGTLPNKGGKYLIPKVNNNPKINWRIKFKKNIKPKKIPGFLNIDLKMQNRPNNSHAPIMNISM